MRVRQSWKRRTTRRRLPSPVRSRRRWSMCPARRSKTKLRRCACTLRGSSAGDCNRSSCPVAILLDVAIARRALERARRDHLHAARDPDPRSQSPRRHRHGNGGYRQCSERHRRGQGEARSVGWLPQHRHGCAGVLVSLHHGRAASLLCRLLGARNGNDRDRRGRLARRAARQPILVRVCGPGHTCVRLVAAAANGGSTAYRTRTPCRLRRSVRDDPVHAGFGCLRLHEADRGAIDSSVACETEAPVVAPLQTQGPMAWRVGAPSICRSRLASSSPIAFAMKLARAGARLRFLSVMVCAVAVLHFDILPGAESKPDTATQPQPKIPAEQLDALVAPIALYPDPLLAQTLAASTYPLEIVQLQQWLAKNPSLKDKALADAVAKQDWDPSIQSMAGLPDVVKRLADDIQWTTDLGNAFLAQQSDVMDAVQRMRKKAQDTGNLKSSAQQKVE